MGVDLTLHRATRASEFRASVGDLLVGFEPAHVAALTEMSRKVPGSQVTLLGAWSRPPNLYVHDPYGTSTEYFRACFRRIESVVVLLSRKVER